MLAEPYLKAGKLEEARQTIEQLDQLSSGTFGPRPELESCWHTIGFTTMRFATFRWLSQQIRKQMM